MLCDANANETENDKKTLINKMEMNFESSCENTVFITL